MGSQPAPSSLLPPSLSLIPVLGQLLPATQPDDPPLPERSPCSMFLELKHCHVTSAAADLSAASVGAWIKSPTFSPGLQGST